MSTLPPPNFIRIVLDLCLGLFDSLRSSSKIKLSLFQQVRYVKRRATKPETLAEQSYWILSGEGEQNVSDCSDQGEVSESQQLISPEKGEEKLIDCQGSNRRLNGETAQRQILSPRTETKCIQCGERFKCLSELTIHQKIHMQGKNI